jgi:hypothetical protein
MLVENDLSPFKVGLKLNETLFSAIARNRFAKYGTPREAFQALASGIEPWRNASPQQLVHDPRSQIYPDAPVRVFHVAARFRVSNGPARIISDVERLGRTWVGSMICHLRLLA